jgi:hypothetical protein
MNIERFEVVMNGGSTRPRGRAVHAHRRPVPPIEVPPRAGAMQ